MTKIDIISGFLGAGKTTFIKRLIGEAISGEKVVLIENEFGEIGIDGGFLKDAGIEIREMNSGCICCSLVGDFGKSLSEVLTKYAPDRVIIEPSGVGKLSDVMKAVRDVASEIEVELNSAVTVADAGKVRMYMKNFGEFFNNQIENAGTIVLSRTDIADPKKVQKAVEMIREKNQRAVIVTTPISQLSGSQLLEIIEKKDDMMEDLLKEARDHAHDHGHHDHHHEHGEECGCGHDHHDHAHHDHDHHHGHGEGCTCGCHDHHHHHADEVFASWGRENVTGVGREKLEEILDELAYGTKYGEVLRAKGMIPAPDGTWLHFDLVPEQVEIREGSADYTGKVCVIGADLDEKALEEAFSAR
ncbi:MAG: GTP-binding protein [Clostridium sp.]|nr:GTP-binding protein [Clostridium sp.]